MPVKDACPHCGQWTEKIIIQYDRNPQVEVCSKCEKIVYVDDYDGPFGKHMVHITPRELYIIQKEAELQRSGLIQKIINYGFPRSFNWED